MRKRSKYDGTPVALQEALKLTYELRARVKTRVKKDLKRNVNTKIVGHQELDRYILQCDPKAARRKQEAWWYEAAMRRLIDTVLVLRAENGSLRRELGRVNRSSDEELDEVAFGRARPEVDAAGIDD